MDVTALLNQLRTERNRIGDAINALEQLNNTTRGSARRTGKAVNRIRGRRKLSAASRARMVAAQRRRRRLEKARKLKP